MSRNLCGFCFLMSMVVMSFSLAMPAQAQAGSFASSPDLTCGPAPCVFPNMQVSSGGQPFLTNVLAADPADSGAMLIGAEDYNCNSRLGIFHSEDTGVTWTHACFPLRSNGEAGGSPIAAYDLNGVAYVGGLQAPTQY